MIRAVQPIYQSVYDRLLNSFWCYPIAAFIGCVLILIVPTALMGRPCRCCAGFMVMRLAHLGARTGWLYGLNTIGAALGVILCGFVLIKSLGVFISLALFACINGVIGLSCILLSRFLPVDSALSESLRHKEPAKTEVPRSGDPHAGPIHWGVLIFAASGFCAMAYEVLWTRLLGLIAGPTNVLFHPRGGHFYRWSGDRQYRVRSPGRQDPQCIGLADRNADGGRHDGACRESAAGQRTVLFRQADSCLARAVFSTCPHAIPGAVRCAAAADPVFWGRHSRWSVRLYVQSIGDMGRRLGTAYALNTVGALAGSFVAGFVLVPWLGKMNGLRLVILLQFCLSGTLLLCLTVMKRKRGRDRMAIVGLIGIGCMLNGPFPPTGALTCISRGWYRDVDALQSDLDRVGWWGGVDEGCPADCRSPPGTGCRFPRRGDQRIYHVSKRETTQFGGLSNSPCSTAARPAMPLPMGIAPRKTLSAHIPMLFHASAEKVMLLGLASGMTAGEILLYPVEQLDLLEINEAVATACRNYFSPWNNGCLDDSRTTPDCPGRPQSSGTYPAVLRCDHLRAFPIPGWPGWPNLYSLEFFRLVRKTLDHRVACLPSGFRPMKWITETFSLLGRTFARCFSQQCLNQGGPRGLSHAGVQ